MRPALRWPASELPAAAAALAKAAEFIEAAEPAERRATAATGPTTQSLGLAAARLGLDVQATPAPRDKPDRALRRDAPVLVPAGAGRVVAVASAGRRRARVAAPGGGVVPVSTRELAAVVSEGAAEDVAAAPSWWLVRSSPGISFWRQGRQAGLPVRLAALVGAHAAEYGLFLWSWAVLGSAAFAGEVGGGELLTWALLLTATVPARVAATRLQADVAIAAGWLLRRRLLHGTLRLDPDATRREGAGQLLGRSLEAEAVEDLAIGGGLLGVLAAVEVTMAVVVLVAGPGLLLPALLVAWVTLTIGAAHRYVRRRWAWAEARLEVTHDLIEKMVGHRTRLVQQPPERRHEGEEERLAAYARLGLAMDRRLNVLLALAPRGWMVVGVGALALEIARGASSTAVAVGAGGILLALSALTRLVMGLAQIADAAVAWSQVAPLFDAAARTAPEPAAPDQDDSVVEAPSVEPVIEAEDLRYQYPGRDEPALVRCSLRIDRGEHLLLEGPSGSGKSSLVALLSGLRRATAGRLRLQGAEQASVGIFAWRREVVASPQFHENHVLLGPLAFNLLIGRRWPPEPHDLQDAYQLCIDLGLGPLLERMPSGLQQMVGDTGWQLSHGERSLVFLGRALLQGAEVVLLDETFGSLDPVAAHRALTVALERTETLVVIRQ